MNVTRIEQQYGDTQNFNYFLCSDLHFGNADQDKVLLKSDFDKAKELDAKILINGDWGDFIIASDRKRYTPSGDIYNSDNPINRTVQDAYNFLLPYKDLIVMIGSGNHEVSQVKYNGVDVTQALIFMLNEKGAKIEHAQYSGFVKFVYKYKKGHAVTERVMYYNHGQGGSAEITKGAIDLNRHMSTKLCDICWLGHKHTKLIMPCEPLLALYNKIDKIYQMNRLGVITGCYLTNINSYDAKKTGYKQRYSEEKMRTLQGQGGVFINHIIGQSKFEQNILSSF